MSPLRVTVVSGLFALAAMSFANVAQDPLFFAFDATGFKSDAHLLPGTKVEDGYGATNRYLLKDGKPWLPVFGEMHFVRVPPQYWGDAIERAKLGGIDVLGTYVFWNHHEEKEGEFDWTGPRNLRKFIQTCKAKGMKVLLRVGPFAHGEARNGGLPDWLYAKGIRERSNDADYLHYVERLYRQIAKQVKGLTVEDGGPIIAIQIENEYQASGAPWETNKSVNPEWASGSWEGVAHMEKLKALVAKVGLKVPLYTCTAWDAAPVPEGVVPMHSFYPVNFWSGTPEHTYDPKADFMLVDRWAHPEWGTAHKVAYAADTRPYLMVEMGVGMVPTLEHRPWAPPEMADASSRILLGGGANSLGYYMYRGGTQLTGPNGAFMNEGTLPRLNYDYQAPIGEYGDYDAKYFRLRPVHMFLQTYGSLLAPMRPYTRGDTTSLSPADVSVPQVSMRSDGDSAFVFLDNYQTGVDLKDFEGVSLAIGLNGGTVRINDITVGKGTTGILPINFSLGGTKLEYATAEPLDTLHYKGEDYYLFDRIPGNEARFIFDSTTGIPEWTSSGAVGTYHFTDKSGHKGCLVVVDRDVAGRLVAAKVGGQKNWIFSDGSTVATTGSTVEVESTFPGGYARAFPSELTDPAQLGMMPRMMGPAEELHFTPTKDGVVKVQIPDGPPSGADDLYLKIDYLGDHCYAYVDNQMVADHYNIGDPWVIRLGRLRKDVWGKEMVLRFGRLNDKTNPAIYVKRRRGQRGLSVDGGLKIDSAAFVPLYRHTYKVGG